MQSSQIDERLAGNYKAATQAQMNAEKAASELFLGLEGKVSLAPPEKLEWSEFSSFANDNITGCLASGDEKQACFLELEDGDFGQEEGDYVVAMGAIEDGNVSVSEPVFVKVSTSFFGFDPEATVSCLGTGCSFVPGEGNSGPVVDGTDREAEGKASGSNRPDPVYDENGDKIFVPAVIMGDMNSSPFSSQGGGVEGQEIYTSSEYASFKQSALGDEYEEASDGWDAVKDVIQSEIDKAVGKASESSEVFYAGPGETVSPGSASGVVVIDGGTLSLGGKDKFTGLVIMRGGNIVSKGTPAIVGAIIGNNYSFMGKGNPAVLYSSEAIGNAQNVGGGSGGASEIISWQ